MACVAVQTFGANRQIVRNVIKACGMQFQRPHCANVAGSRRRGVGTTKQRSMQRHRLRRGGGRLAPTSTLRAITVA
jgi:hypothetical protein